MKKKLVGQEQKLAANFQAIQRIKGNASLTNQVTVNMIVGQLINYY